MKLYLQEKNMHNIVDKFVQQNKEFLSMRKRGSNNLIFGRTFSLGQYLCLYIGQEILRLLRNRKDYFVLVDCGLTKVRKMHRRKSKYPDILVVKKTNSSKFTNINLIEKVTNQNNKLFEKFSSIKKQESADVFEAIALLEIKTDLGYINSRDVIKNFIAWQEFSKKSEIFTFKCMYEKEKNLSLDKGDFWYKPSSIIKFTPKMRRTLIFGCFENHPVRKNEIFKIKRKYEIKKGLRMNGPYSLLKDKRHIRNREALKYITEKPLRII